MSQSEQKATLALSVAESSVWRVALLALGLAWLAILVLYRDTAIAMVTIWYRSETFTHAFLVPPIALWLVWRKREELATLMPRPSPLVLVALAAMAFAWLLGDLVAVNSVTQLSFVAMVVLAVPAVLGIHVASRIVFPLAFLFLSVPIGEFLMPQLMESTADFTVLALRLTGIPVYREGLQFVIPSGNWSVVEACSGVRYLIASFTVGTLFAYLNYQTTLRRVLFMLVSLLVPVIANWLRAYMIVMLGHLSGNQLAVGVDHLIYGWVFFGVVVMLMFAIGAKWSEPEGVAPTGVRLPVRPATIPAQRGLWSVLACLVVIVALPSGALRALEPKSLASPPLLRPPTVLASGWRVEGPSQTGFKPLFKNPSAELNSSFTNDGQTVGVYLGYYRDQNYERKLVSSDNVLVASWDPVWNSVEAGVKETAFGRQSAKVITADLRRSPVSDVAQGGRLRVWQVYWIGGTLTSNDYFAKVYSAAYRLMGRGDESAVIVFYTEKREGVSSDAVLEAFSAANYGEIDAMLRTATASR